MVRKGTFKRLIPIITGVSILANALLSYATLHSRSALKKIEEELGKKEAAQLINVRGGHPFATVKNDLAGIAEDMEELRGRIPEAKKLFEEYLKAREQVERLKKQGMEAGDANRKADYYGKLVKFGDEEQKIRFLFYRVLYIYLKDMKNKGLAVPAMVRAVELSQEEFYGWFIAAREGAGIKNWTFSSDY